MQMVIICDFLIPPPSRRGRIGGGKSAGYDPIYSQAAWLPGDVGDESSGNGFCYYLRHFAWTAGMQIAFLSVFPEHLAMIGRRGVHGRQYLLEGSLK
jgi:hypothetical protein